MKTEIKSPLTLKMKTNPSMVSPTNDRTNYFYKMKLGKYVFINLLKQAIICYKYSRFFEDCSIFLEI